MGSNPRESRTRPSKGHPERAVKKKVTLTEQYDKTGVGLVMMDFSGAAWFLGNRDLPIRIREGARMVVEFNDELEAFLVTVSNEEVDQTGGEALLEPVLKGFDEKGYGTGLVKELDLKGGMADGKLVKKIKQGAKLEISRVGDGENYLFELTKPGVDRRVQQYLRLYGLVQFLATNRGQGGSIIWPGIEDADQDKRDDYIKEAMELWENMSDFWFLLAGYEPTWMNRSMSWDEA